MKILIKSDFNFSVSGIRYSEGRLAVELAAPSGQTRPDSLRYTYELEIGDGQASPHPSSSLLEYAKRYAERSGIKAKTKSSYELMIKHLMAYGDRELDAVTTDYLQGFIAHLERRGLKRGTVRLYFQKVSCVLHDAYKNGLFDDRVLLRVRRPRREQGKKVFLTEREVRRMMNAKLPEKDANLRNMFLFSCFSGLRFGDVSNLRWRDVKQQGRHLLLEYHQQKTDTDERVPLCPYAEALLRGLERGNGYVFGRESEQRANKVLKAWSRSARVGKSVSFHTARHTFCVMLLTHDVPLFTVQQLMCHADIGSTKAYADLLNRTKAKAVRRIPLPS